MTFIHFTQEATREAREAAEYFGLRPSANEPPSGVYLLADAEGISLCRAGEKGRVRVDFGGGAAQYRRLKGGGELIAKAVNHTSQPTVWDGTGGLGRDSFVLASLGLSVRTFEQNPAVACLLADGLKRALQQPEVAEIAGRIALQFGDAGKLLPMAAEQFGRPDVVYLDPMYPERQKSAAVKKEMAYFHDLVGAAQDEAALLSAARMVAKKRVVVKRPRLGEYLNGEKPAYQYTGKSTRFDVYLPDNPAKD
ncbi:class I SAM-dependent methyltransferase [Neisseria animalis]|uniref:Ribosomal RNA small subunit methyltransferase J n=1 Tax=Neisseria animalis TaxID=492 RepID=A0A5P3MSQ8_NEIAN|nr:class I SAM-dependent methyltransferase [Neisseria animalis]QEY24125.1 16S rRNA methyltransferase [Neisseria animalis]ROW31517.1 16S rRNA methyltransferase [Neisseria animalis]VEE06340.1 Ribosomal RNA small subunit methyltransferase J [Neisseria animalis]